MARWLSFNMGPLAKAQLAITLIDGSLDFKQNIESFQVNLKSSPKAPRWHQKRHLAAIGPSFEFGFGKGSFATEICVREDLGRTFRPNVQGTVKTHGSGR